MFVVKKNNKFGDLMDISINYFCTRAISFFRNNFLTPLTALQRKILVIGSGALRFLAGCYAINRCCFKAKMPKKEKTFDVLKAKEISNKEKSHLDPVELLPQEMLFHILKFLDPKSLSAVSQTSKFLHDFSQDKALMNPTLKALENKLSLLPLDKKLELAMKRGTVLTELNLSNSNVTDEQLAELFKACPNLQSLNLSGCENLTDVSIIKLPEDLKFLDISSCWNLTDKALEKLPKGLLTLKLVCLNLRDPVISKLPKGLLELDLTWYSKLTDDAISNLPENLKSLNLNSCQLLTDAAIEKLPKGLKSLNLYRCKNLKGKTLGKLPQDLRKLHLSLGRNFTDLSLGSLPKGLEALTLNCEDLTETEIEKLSRDLLSHTRRQLRELKSLNLFPNKLKENVINCLRARNITINDRYT
jgi:hypothetical protein